MSQMVPNQLVPGQVVQGQVVTAAQVVNSAGGQVVMSNNNIVGGQIVNDQLMMQQLQSTAVTNTALQSQPAVLQQQQVVQQQVQQEAVPANVVQNHQAVLGNLTAQGQPAQQQVKLAPIPPPASSVQDAQPPVISRSRLTDLVREVDPTEQLDEEVEEVLLNIADDFIESSVNAACKLAKHRGARTLDVRDLHMYLERYWRIWIPGFGTEELKPYKRAPTTEAHKQRMALIRKAVKKY